VQGRINYIITGKKSAWGKGKGGGRGRMGRGEEMPTRGKQLLQCSTVYFNRRVHILL
jgi:hypothetical protein